MEITFLGHSAFRLRGKDATVVTDPYPPTIGYSMGKVAAEIVTVSHSSPNHSYVEGVTGSPRVINGPGEYEIADILIAGVATQEGRGEGPRNTAYVLRFDDLAICHLGDLHDTLSDKQMESLGSVDILFIPVGGKGALGPTLAAEVVTQLEPSLIVPMHYSLNGGTVQGLERVDLFLREMGTKEYTPDAKLTVSRASLPSEVRIVVLENRRG